MKRKTGHVLQIIISLQREAVDYPWTASCARTIVSLKKESRAVAVETFSKDSVEAIVIKMRAIDIRKIILPN